jgi:hypothetical protein
MGKREHFVTPLTCPECALNGSATWEEDEKGNLETTIKILSSGCCFELRDSLRRMRR